MSHDTQALQTREQIDTHIMEQVVIGGDLSKLTPQQRVSYYNALCRSLGLNPLTKPFEYIKLDSKLVLYARKDCAEQLRTTRRVSITDIETETLGDLLIVTAYAMLPDGRRDADRGVVYLKGLFGDQLSNAHMKCFHPDTDVLTTQGWKSMGTITHKDAVGQFDPETGKIDFAFPLQLVMTETAAWVRIEDNLTCQCVTPNHDVLVGAYKVEALDLMHREM